MLASSDTNILGMHWLVVIFGGITISEFITMTGPFNFKLIISTAFSTYTLTTIPGLLCGWGGWCCVRLAGTLLSCPNSKFLLMTNTRPFKVKSTTSVVSRCDV
jgi:hypothetical protein